MEWNVKKWLGNVFGGEAAPKQDAPSTAPLSVLTGDRWMRHVVIGSRRMEEEHSSAAMLQDDGSWKITQNFIRDGSIVTSTVAGAGMTEHRAALTLKEIAIGQMENLQPQGFNLGNENVDGSGIQHYLEFLGKHEARQARISTPPGVK